MKKSTGHTVRLSGATNPEIRSARQGVKASHLSSNPINVNPDRHFEDEVKKAFFRVFFNIYF